MVENRMRIFFFILTIFFSFNILANDNLSGTKLFCGFDSIVTQDIFEKVDYLAINFDDLENVTLYQSKYFVVDDSKIINNLQGKYFTKIKSITINYKDIYNFDLNYTLIIDRASLYLKKYLDNQQTENIPCKIINEKNLSEYLSQKFEEDVLKLENFIKKENKI
tara:strand:+ start:54 stop:545 length:492 start_codon:yes stop_codon:yes gene_type:complete